MLDVLAQRLEAYGTAEAIAWSGASVSYAELRTLISKWSEWLNTSGLTTGSTVLINADFSPTSVALLLAMLKQRMIVALTTGLPQAKVVEYRDLCAASAEITVTNEGTVSCVAHKAPSVELPLIKQLRDLGHPGLVIFSSGSTGQSKAAVHDALPLLEKFRTVGRCTRVVAFLLFDHIGGLNTMFYTLFNGGTLVLSEARTPHVVAAAIAKHKAEALTTTPTFLRLLLMTKSYEAHDLSSLKVINYGTEVMPEATLKELHLLMPTVRLSQAYGLSEVGVLPVRSCASDSLFVTIDPSEATVRVRDGMLEIKSASAMLGYLNAPSPFSADGWLRTGDKVEVDGNSLRILGRASEMINVGGQKVYPAEVENLLMQLDGVADVVVSSEPNVLLGQAVRAEVVLTTEESVRDFSARMRRQCSGKVPAYMLPQRIIIRSEPVHGVRFKKLRNTLQEGANS